MKYLYVLTDRGLANRLRALVSGMWMADRLDLGLVLGWPVGRALGCPFDALFENDIDQDAEKLAGLSSVRYRDARHVDPAAHHRQEVLELHTCQPFSHDPSVVAYSNEFWTAVRPYLLSLTPVAEVRERVDAVSARFTERMLGVHYRWDGRDFKYTTPELFFHEIDAILEQESGTRIYLASDSTEAIERFRERYADAVQTLDDAGSPAPRVRDAAEGVRTALADLILLSRTQKLMGTFHSSFTEIAGVLGAIPFKNIGSFADRTLQQHDFVVRVRRPK